MGDAARSMARAMVYTLACCVWPCMAGCQSAASRTGGALALSSRRPYARGRVLELGVSGGATLAGPQDVKLKRSAKTGALRDYLFFRDVDVAPVAVASASTTIWGSPPVTRHLGLQLDLSHWRTNVRTEEYVNRGPVRSATARPPFRDFTSTRSAAFLYMMGRFVPPDWGAFDPMRGYLYAGIGGGMVYTHVPRGHSGWAPGVGALAGWSTPLGSRTRLRIEGRWTITHDADSPPSSDWRVDTSGVHAAPGPAHLDTNFFSLLAGVSFRL